MNTRRNGTAEAHQTSHQCFHSFTLASFLLSVANSGQPIANWDGFSIRHEVRRAKDVCFRSDFHVAEAAKVVGVETFQEAVRIEREAPTPVHAIRKTATKSLVWILAFSHNISVSQYKQAVAGVGHNPCTLLRNCRLLTRLVSSDGRKLLFLPHKPVHPLTNMPCTECTPYKPCTADWTGL